MEFIEPIVEKILAVLQAHTPALLGSLPGFETYKKHFTGVVENWPAVWVMPVRSEFDPEVTGHSAQRHLITIKLAISGSEPNELAEQAMAYMQVIHLALAASWPGEWCTTLAAGQVLGLRVRSHDYGPLWEQGQMLARFPEMEVAVDTAENWGGVEGV